MFRAARREKRPRRRNDGTSLKAAETPTSVLKVSRGGTRDIFPRLLVLIYNGKHGVNPWDTICHRSTQNRSQQFSTTSAERSVRNREGVAGFIWNRVWECPHIGCCSGR